MCEQCVLAGEMTPEEWEVEKKKIQAEVHVRFKAVRTIFNGQHEDVVINTLMNLLAYYAVEFGIPPYILIEGFIGMVKDIHPEVISEIKH